MLTLLTLLTLLCLSEFRHFVFDDLRWKVIGCFVDICGIADHYCLNFLSIIRNIWRSMHCITDNFEWKLVGYHYQKLFTFFSERILDIITENSNWNTGEGLQATIALPVYGLWTDRCSLFVHSFQIKSVLEIMEITHTETNRGNKVTIVDGYMYRRINVPKNGDIVYIYAA